MVNSERRNGYADIAGALGEIKGKVSGMNDKLDMFIEAVKDKQEAQDDKITLNAKAVSAVAKKVDRFTWAGAGVGGTLTGLYGLLIVKGDALRQTFSNFFTGE